VVVLVVLLSEDATDKFFAVEKEVFWIVGEVLKHLRCWFRKPASI
jgi:hypothetical protein